MLVLLFGAFASGATDSGTRLDHVGIMHVDHEDTKVMVIVQVALLTNRVMLMLVAFVKERHLSGISGGGTAATTTTTITYFLTTTATTTTTTTTTTFSLTRP